MLVSSVVVLLRGVSTDILQAWIEHLVFVSLLSTGTVLLGIGSYFTSTNRVTQYQYH